MTRSSILFRFLLVTLVLSLLFSACKQSAKPTPLPGGTLVTLTFFDVGESGDGFLVSTREGAHMLVDGGRRGSGVTQMLQRLGVKELEHVIGTNPDADHIGGLIEVFQKLRVRNAWLSGDTNTTITFEDYVDAIEASGAEVHEARRGDVLRLGGFTATVVSPFEPMFSDRNNNSVAVRLVVGKVSFLLAGDMEAPAERRLVALSSEPPLRSTVLKLGHHGSRTSTSEEFLAAVRPEAAIYQAGANNRFGHPHAEVLARLKAAGVATYGTGANGTIVITTDGERFTVRTER